MSTSELTALYGVDNSTVCLVLERAGIPRVGRAAKIAARIRACAYTPCGKAFTTIPAKARQRYCSAECAACASRIEARNPTLLSDLTQLYREDGLSLNAAATVVGISTTASRDVLVRHGVPIRHRDAFPTEGVANLALSLYLAGRSLKTSAQLVDADPRSLARLLAARGVPLRRGGDACRRLPLRVDAFSFLSDEATYWLGFLMADGGVYASSLCLTLGIWDAEHVRALNQFLDGGSARALTLTARAAGMRWTSARLVADLAYWGVLPRKSLTAEGRHGITSEPSFWRGMIDGDGHINARDRAVTLYTASQRIAEQYTHFLRSLDLTPRVYARRQPRFYSVRLRQDDSGRLLDMIYPPRCTALARKAAVVEEMRSLQ